MCMFLFVVKSILFFLTLPIILNNMLAHREKFSIYTHSQRVLKLKSPAIQVVDLTANLAAKACPI